MEVFSLFFRSEVAHSLVNSTAAYGGLENSRVLGQEEAESKFSQFFS